MFNLKMVDTAGGGIRKLFLFQRQRFFPMPDYDLSGNRVQLTLTGKVLDMDYARMLARDGGLALPDIMALDKVQKRQALTADEERRLKSGGLIEGRKPNYFIAKTLAQQTGQKASYSKNLAFDKQYYLDLICKAVKEHGSLARKDIDELLWNKLPDWMDDKQRRIKVGNLIAELRRKQRIVNQGSDTRPSWALVQPDVR
jgi:ATP-dependent DNA helicase RecG